MIQFPKLFDRICTAPRRLWAAIVRLVIQPGRHDLGSSLLVTASLLIPIWARPVAAQVGVSETEQVLCSGALNVAQIVAIGLGLVSGYFILKGMLRMQIGIDIIHRLEHIGADGIRRTDATPKQGKKKARGGVYSWAAALLPVFVPVLLAVAGIDYVSCLLP
jgi:hypothetical protein